MTPTLENARVAPPEFGEGIQQFLVEREIGGRAIHGGPIVLWVYPRQRENLVDCKCRIVYDVTKASKRFAVSESEDADVRGVWVCACMGRLIE